MHTATSYNLHLKAVVKWAFVHKETGKGRSKDALRAKSNSSVETHFLGKYELDE